MNCVATNIKNYDETILARAEEKYSIIIREDVKLFLKKNTGGYPIKDIIAVNEEKYEIRTFLSVNRSDENYCIEKPLDYFLQKTKGKVIPIGIDSGDNYYCVNNETGKVYYWRAGEDMYYCIAMSLDEFVIFFD